MKKIVITLLIISLTFNMIFIFKIVETKKNIERNLMYIYHGTIGIVDDTIKEVANSVKNESDTKILKETLFEAQRRIQNCELILSQTKRLNSKFDLPIDSFTDFFYDVYKKQGENRKMSSDEIEKIEDLSKMGLYTPLQGVFEKDNSFWSEKVISKLYMDKFREIESFLRKTD